MSMSCGDCEPLLSAQLQVVRDELRADTDQQLDELRQRVCTLCFKTVGYINLHTLAINLHKSGHLYGELLLCLIFTHKRSFFCECI